MLWHSPSVSFYQRALNIFFIIKTNNFFSISLKTILTCRTDYVKTTKWVLTVKHVMPNEFQI